MAYNEVHEPSSSPSAHRAEAAQSRRKIKSIDKDVTTTAAGKTSWDHDGLTDGEVVAVVHAKARSARSHAAYARTPLADKSLAGFL
jgi:hypothetical protein